MPPSSSTHPGCPIRCQTEEKAHFPRYKVEVCIAIGQAPHSTFATGKRRKIPKELFLLFRFFLGFAGNHNKCYITPGLSYKGQRSRPRQPTIWMGGGREGERRTDNNDTLGDSKKRKKKKVSWVVERGKKGWKSG